VTTVTAAITVKPDQENDLLAKSAILLVKLTSSVPRVNS